MTEYHFVSERRRHRLGRGPAKESHAARREREAEEARRFWAARAEQVADPLAVGSGLT
jgi:hypothetical protein